MRAANMHRLYSLVSFTLALAFSTSHVATAESTAQPPKPNESIPTKDGFGEGWKQTVRSKPGDAPCDEFVIWVENGWLFARRVDEHGDLDWQVKLARSESYGPPQLAMKGMGFGFQVKSKKIPYTVRETLSFLRVLRQLDESTNGAVSRESLLRDAKSIGWGGAKRGVIAGWQMGDWIYIATGPDRERIDCIVRLNPVKKAGNGYGVQTALGDLLYMFHGDTRLWDDGEILVASRTLAGRMKAKRLPANFVRVYRAPKLRRSRQRLGSTLSHFL
jgi:hypothetical protein